MLQIRHSFLPFAMLEQLQLDDIGYNPDIPFGNHAHAEINLIIIKNIAHLLFSVKARSFLQLVLTQLNIFVVQVVC